MHSRRSSLAASVSASPCQYSSLISVRMDCMSYPPLASFSICGTPLHYGRGGSCARPDRATTRVAPTLAYLSPKAVNSRHLGQLVTHLLEQHFPGKPA